MVRGVRNSSAAMHPMDTAAKKTKNPQETTVDDAAQKAIQKAAAAKAREERLAKRNEKKEELPAPVIAQVPQQAPEQVSEALALAPFKAPRQPAGPGLEEFMNYFRGFVDQEANNNSSEIVSYNAQAAEESMTISAVKGFVKMVKDSGAIKQMFEPMLELIKEEIRAKGFPSDEEIAAGVKELFQQYYQAIPKNLDYIKPALESELTSALKQTFLELEAELTRDNVARRLFNPTAEDLAGIRAAGLNLDQANNELRAKMAAKAENLQKTSQKPQPVPAEEPKEASKAEASKETKEANTEEAPRSLFGRITVILGSIASFFKKAGSKLISAVSSIINFVKSIFVKSPKVEFVKPEEKA